MNIEPELWIGALVLTIITVLVTGPGLWSENWDLMKVSRSKPPPGQQEAEPAKPPSNPE